MGSNFPKYTEHLKKLPDSIDERDFKKIVDMIEKSRAAGKADPKAQIPKHRDVLKKAAAELKAMQDDLKKNKDTKALKSLDNIVKQVDQELALFNRMK